MRILGNLHRVKLMAVLNALALSAIAVGCASMAPPRMDESDLLAAGFKVLVATTTVQQQWVQTLPAGEIRPMQRTGKKYFVYPDAAKNQIYVGSPQAFEAYRRRHPEVQPMTQESGMASYVKQSDAMDSASARDMSDPYFGLSWSDLGW